MGITKPHKFEEIIGHSKLIEFIKDKFNNGTFPQAVIFYGEEGTGKTTLSNAVTLALNCLSGIKPCYECELCREISEQLIDKDQDTMNVKTFRMSVKGNIDVARNIIEAMNTNFIEKGVRVIRLEEMQRMLDTAQDALLSPLDNIPKNVFIIGTTTDLSKLGAAFLSRFVVYNLNKLSPRDMMALLRKDAERRGLKIQGGENTLELIATWADYKPRAALQCLNAFGEKASIRLEEVKEFLSFLDVKNIIPILSSFNGSYLKGINTIERLTVDLHTKRNLIMLMIEVVKIANKEKSLKFSTEDYILVKEAILGVDPTYYLRFLYHIADSNVLDREGLLVAYLRSHPSLDKLTTPNEENLQFEYAQKLSNGSKTEIVNEERKPRRSMRELTMGGKVVKD